MFHAFWIPPRCCSQAMLHWEDCSAIKLCAFSDYWTLLEVTRGYLNSFFWVESICGETGQTGVLKRSRWQQRSHVSGDKTWAGSSKFPLLLHIFLCDSLVNASVLYCAFKKARIPLLWFLVAESTIISLPHFAQKAKGLGSVLANKVCLQLQVTVGHLTMHITLNLCTYSSDTQLSSPACTYDIHVCKCSGGQWGNSSLFKFST